MHEHEQKRKLLEEIEGLMAYGERNSSAIHPTLLRYLDDEALRSILDRLRSKHNRLTHEDKEWLQKFKKEESLS